MTPAPTIAPTTTPHPDYPLTFTPWELAGLPLRNHVFMSAHGTNFQHDGAPSRQYADYLAERAAGGVALMVTEGAHVHPTSGGPRMIDLWREESRSGLEGLSDAAHRHGTKIFVQLLHNGRQTEPVMIGQPVVAPSALRDPAHSFTAHALTRAEIAELVAAFADSAAVSAATGFDGVELNGAHGYLIEQFLSPFMNRRTDSYGGSHENRLRFARDVVRAVLDRVGQDIVVGARLTAYETVPGGLDRAESLDFTAELAAEGVHFVSVSIGQHATPLLVVPTAGVPTLPVLDEVEVVRKTVSCAVFASHRVRRIADVESVLERGIADMVNMSRAHIADPAIVNKALQGREQEIRPCIGCVQGCRGQLVLNLPIGCLVNPRVGREARYTEIPAEFPERIAVVGGGIAGMQFASTAASRGHEVALFERGTELGGWLRKSAVLPERAEFAGFTDALEGELSRNGVSVRLGHEPTQHELTGYDQVVVAVGAQRPEVREEDWPNVGVPVWGLTEALEREAPAGGRVVILDRGDHHNVAILLARRLVEQRAAAVDILDPTGSAGRKLHALNRNYMTRNFTEDHIRTASNVTSLRIAGRSVSFCHDGWPQTLPEIDLLVVLEPPAPRDPTDWEGLDDVVLLGDCDAPGLAVEIVHQAYAKGLSV